MGRQFSSSHHLPCALKFLIVPIFVEIPNGSLLGGERESPRCHSDEEVEDDLNMILFVI